MFGETVKDASEKVGEVGPPGGNRVAGAMSQLVIRARRRIRAAMMLAGACRWIVTGLGLWLAFFAVDNVLALPAGLRLPLAVGGGALLLGVLVRQVLLPGLRRLRPERVAMLLESRYGIRDNLLINAFQFEGRQFDGGEAMFAGSTVAKCEEAVGGLDMGQLWEVRRMWPWAAGAVGVLVAWMAYAWMFPGFLVNAGQRFAMPLAEISPPGAPVITVTPSGDVAIAEGDSINVRAEVVDRRPVAAGRDEPPVIVWIENAKSVPTVRGQGEEAVMVPADGRAGNWAHTFAGVRRPFAFRVFAAGTQSAVVSVQVFALPKISASIFRVTPPEYTGLGAMASAGPPATLSALSGSRVDVEIAVDPMPGAVRWRDPSGQVDMVAREGKWRASRVVQAAAPYEIEARVAKVNRDVVIARSQVQVTPDVSPEVEFVSQDRNRFAFPGTTVRLSVKASDDLGLKGVWVTTRPAEGEGSSRTEVKRWAYFGPPGRKGEVQEKLGLVIDPARFRVGEAYLVEAWAADFNPAGKPASSRPILIRIRSPMESDLDRGDPLVRAFERLRQSLAAQERAMGLTGNLRGHLEEAVAKQDLHEHRRAIGEAQAAGLQAGAEALEGFRASDEGKAYGDELAPLVEGEMPWIAGDIEKLNLAGSSGAARVVEAILGRQTHVRDEMLALLGRITEERKGKGSEPKSQERDERTREALAKDLKTELDSFVREQSKVVDRSKALAGKAPEDLTEEEREVLGELARKEAGLAKKLKKKSGEFAGKPEEDPSAEEARGALENVADEARAASDAMYKKDAAQAVPRAQASLEAAAKLAEELGRQLGESGQADAPEQKQTPAADGTPVAESPVEMEDAVRGLLGEQAAMSGEIEDVTRGLIGSSEPAGAGTPAPSAQPLGQVESSMRTDTEVGGRASAGPSGRSNGQMVGESAEGVGAGKAPARLSQTAFEDGKVKDGEQKDSGGGTGGGKLAGFSEVGLRGSGEPPKTEEKAPRLAERQSLIRQRAEQLALRLRTQRVATGDLENSVEAMRRVERSLQAGDGFGVQSAYSAALDALQESRATMRAMAGVLRERTQMSPKVRDEIAAGLRDGVPQGYDEMISAYFRALAEGKAIGQEATVAPADARTGPATNP